MTKIFSLGNPALRRARHRARFLSRARQAGYGMIEIIAGIAIVGILAALGAIAIDSFAVSGAAPKVAADLQRYIMTTKGNAVGVFQPYQGINTQHLGLVLRDSSVLTINDDRTVIAHGLGGNGNTTGLVTVAPVNAGGGFSITLDSVGNAACPALAAAMRKAVTRITMTGTSTVTVMDTSASPQVRWDPQTAQAQCVDGDNNTFVFSVGAL